MTLGQTTKLSHQWTFRNQLPHSEAAVSDGTRTVGVGQDDVWTLPSELQSDLLQVTAARRLLDQVTHLMDTNHMKKVFIFRQKAPPGETEGRHQEPL